MILPRITRQAYLRPDGVPAVCFRGGDDNAGRAAILTIWDDEVILVLHFAEAEGREELAFKWAGPLDLEGVHMAGASAIAAWLNGEEWKPCDTPPE